MTDGTNNVYENKLKECNKWENFNNWLYCICVVTFDLELGQALECIYPKHVRLSKQEITNICYLAFPDSNSGCMGDTTFIIRLQNSDNSKTHLNTELNKYNTKCPIALQIDESYYWGYVYFRQVKDITLPRGYFQKSVVILSLLPFNNLFSKICSFVAPEYFDNGDVSLETVCYNINSWPPPTPGVTLNLPLLGSVFQTYIPESGGTSSHSTVALLSEANENQILTHVEDLNLFEILQPVLSHIHLLWELVITTEPIVVMAPSPTYCSSMVLALTRIISPLQFCGGYRPYFTIHDSEFKQFTSKVNGPPPVILGVTNPFFAKTLHHWPHTIRLSDDINTNSSVQHKYKLKKTAPTKLIDNTSGIYTTYKPFLQKDKNIIKKLLLGVDSKRPSQVQSALLRRHLLELTQTFMIPLERYIASLMPLQKFISPFKAAPTPLPFNPDDFFATLEMAGPQLTTGIKGDWVGLYQKFFRTPNFKAWFNMRYRELTLKLQALHLEALSKADLKDWVQGRPEVEVVDMVLKLKNKISSCNGNDINVTDRIKQQLNQRLNDIVASLPDDLKNILQVS